MQARREYGGPRIDAIEAQVYEGGLTLTLLLVQDAFYNRALYYIEDENFADAIQAFAMTYAKRSAA